MTCPHCYSPNSGEDTKKTKDGQVVYVCTVCAKEFKSDEDLDGLVEKV